jgi:hypothetical protein
MYYSTFLFLQSMYHLSVAKLTHFQLVNLIGHFYFFELVGIHNISRLVELDICMLHS